MKKITPLPWKSNCVSILGSDGDVIAKLQGIFSQRMADGDFIVRACSKHDALVEALLSMKERDHEGIPCFCMTEPDDFHAHENRCRKIRSALKVKP